MEQPAAMEPPQPEEVPPAMEEAEAPAEKVPEAEAPKEEAPAEVPAA